MVLPVAPKLKAVKLYRQQNTYAERLKAFGGEKRIRQTPQESVSISKDARKLLEASRRKPVDQQAITYENPRIQNRRLGPTGPLNPVMA